jgi:ankyrin repeat protein
MHCVRAAIEHCRPTAMAWFLEDSGLRTRVKAAILAVQWGKASATRRLSKMGVDFGYVSATAGWPSLYRAVGMELDTPTVCCAALLFAVVRAVPDVVLDLIQRGVDVNGDGQGAPIHGAVLLPDAGSLEDDQDGVARRPDLGRSILQILLDAGADTERKDEEGQTALHKASSFGNSTACKALLAAHANVDSRDNGDCTPLILASACGHVETQRILIEAHADVEATAANGYSALRWAARSRQIASIKVLVQCGANVNATNPDGHTALHLAAGGGYLDVIQVLLDAGANEGALENHAGMTAFDLGLAMGHPEVATLLQPSTS